MFAGNADRIARWLSFCVIALLVVWGIALSVWAGHMGPLVATVLSFFMLAIVWVAVAAVVLAPVALTARLFRRRDRREATRKFP